MPWPKSSPGAPADESREELTAERRRSKGQMRAVTSSREPGARRGSNGYGGLGEEIEESGRVVGSLDDEQPGLYMQKKKQGVVKVGEL